MNTITKLTAVKIGQTISASERPMRRIPKNLPPRLDAATCLAIIESIDPDLTAARIMASASKLDVNDVDNIMEHTEWSVDDRMYFKATLSENGLMSRGRLINGR
jgi:hypothetical protein